MRYSLHGLLFGPGLAPAGTRVDASLDALQLVLTLPDGRRISSPLAGLSLRKAGFNETHYELSWAQEGQNWALLIDDPSVIAPLLIKPPAGLVIAVGELLRRKRRAGIRRGLGFSAVAIWIALPLFLILALLLAARPLAGVVANLIPISTEQSLGDWAFKAQAPRLHLLTGTVANDALTQIGQRLVEGSDYDYRWYIARDPSLNAFAMPGGIVVVYTGLIAATDSAEELAGVLAHEIEHVELRHSLKAVMQQAGLRLTITALFGDIGIAGKAAGQLSDLSFSRGSEREADRLGLERLLRAGIDPRGMPTLFTKLGAQSGPSTLAWMSSHPGTAQRIEALKTAIAERQPTEIRPHDLDWDAVRTSIAE